MSYDISGRDVWIVSYRILNTKTEKSYLASETCYIYERVKQVVKDLRLGIAPTFALSDTEVIQGYTVYLNAKSRDITQELEAML